ncbi:MULTISPECIES: molecular chaperone [Gammaproteobacteria]|uniref:fimbrial biogenesis chaperone n=1 Tax=Gammaproteobacteria TaxID=1236 RepID=UPI0018684C6A|nr:MULTISPECIES: molecular chaperone [Gammaproteobacteria]
MIKKIKFIASLIYIPLSTFSYSSIEINKDKFIFIESNNKEIIEIKNKTDNDYFIQSWISPYDEENSNEPPFMITPPLFKIEKNEQFSLKIFKTDETIAKDKETIYRVNIKKTPILSNSDSNKNLLHISINSVYNLIYRPISIEKNANKAYKEIEFLKNKNNEFIINNPTPYFITLLKISYNGKLFIDKSKTIPPFKKYNTKKTIQENGIVNWKTYNQYNMEINAIEKAVINEN